jgi:hypothetical protein
MINWIIKLLGGYTQREFDEAVGISGVLLHKVHKLQHWKNQPRDSKGRFIKE